jgi:putative oxidoreductase
MSGAIILLLATVFVMAAIAKLRSTDAFRTVLRALLPRAMVGPAAVVVPVFELALAAFLLSGVAPKNAIACGAGTLGIFTIVLAVMWWRGIKGCACFGEGVNTATTGSGILRNLILMAAAVYAIKEPGPINFFGPDVSSLLARATVVVGSLCLWATVSALVNLRKIYFNHLS